MTEVVVSGVVGGLLGSAHCLGMCGGFAAALGASEVPFGAVFTRQVVYGLGRILTYSFLGMTGGWVGLRLQAYSGSLVTAQQVFSVVAGVLMVIIGLSVLGVVRWPWTRVSVLGELLAPAFRQCLNARRFGGFFAAGMANGFLPCGLVYAFLAMAVSSADLTRGAILMAAFGFGTLPAMVAIGCGARMLSAAMRIKIFRLAACFVIVLGVTTIVRGLPSRAENCCAGHTDASGAARHDADAVVLSNP